MADVVDRVKRRLRDVQPRTILIGALALFYLYCWPGFVGWDTRAHMLSARSGVHTDGHPPAVSWLFRICELLIAGPAGMLLIQSITLLVGLYLLLRTRMAPRTAALVASAIFLFPPVAGFTALIAKDGLMAGFLILGFAFLVDKRPGRQWVAVVFLLAASLMRWNALAATFAPTILLFRWSPSVAGIRRYAIAVAIWLGITGASYQVNELLSDGREYTWYWSIAYQDIAGTIQYIDTLDDATAHEMLADVPLRIDRDIQARFRAIYFAGHFFQLMQGEGRILDVPVGDDERDAVYRAWKRFVYGHPKEYLRYRWDNFMLLLGIDRPYSPPGTSALYVWFTVVGSPITIPELEHDVAPSAIQSKLRTAAIWISVTPLFFMYFYFAACFILLVLCRRRALEVALLLSAIGYQLAWFVLAATTDLRYSQWMVLCSLIVTALFVHQLRTASAAAPDARRE